MINHPSAVGRPCEELTTNSDARLSSAAKKVQRLHGGGGCLMTVFVFEERLHRMSIYTAAPHYSIRIVRVVLEKGAEFFC